MVNVPQLTVWPERLWPFTRLDHWVTDMVHDYSLFNLYATITLNGFGVIWWFSRPLKASLVFSARGTNPRKKKMALGFSTLFPATNAYQQHPPDDVIQVPKDKYSILVNILLIITLISVKRRLYASWQRKKILSLMLTNKSWVWSSNCFFIKEWRINRIAKLNCV